MRQILIKDKRLGLLVTHGEHPIQVGEEVIGGINFLRDNWISPDGTLIAS